jgi:hypothetical protein
MDYSDYTVFYNFMVDTTGTHLSYLTTAQRNQILDNADASLLVPRGTAMNEQTTEFCYTNATYWIESVGKILVPNLDPVKSDINLRVTTIVGNDGRGYSGYSGPTPANWKGYWKEGYVEWVTDPDGSNGRWEEKK